jgi:hypothetical protein
MTGDSKAVKKMLILTIDLTTEWKCRVVSTYTYLDSLIPMHGPA